MRSYNRFFLAKGLRVNDVYRHLPASKYTREQTHTHTHNKTAAAAAAAAATTTDAYYHVELE